MFQQKNTLILLWLFIFSLLFTFCNDRKPLIEKNESFETEKNNQLFVFVGQKIWVKDVPQDKDSWDGKFYARYKILQRVYGNYNNDFIEFTAYDHYGIPGFSNYENAMLFVSKYNDKYLHEKYQYYGVFKSKDGRWATPYSVHDFGQDGKRTSIIHPQKVEFEKEVSFPLSLVKKEEIDCWFPEPFYRIERDKAIALYGNYIEELFEIKKQGVLTARGLFGNKKSNEEDVVDTQMAEILGRSNRKDSVIFDQCRSSLLNLQDKNQSKLGDLTLDSILINDSSCLSKEAFNRGIIDSFVFKALKDSSMINYSISAIPNKDVVHLKSKNSVFKRDGKYILWRLTVTKKRIKTIETICIFNFIKMNNRVKLYSCDQYERSTCWQ